MKFVTTSLPIVAALLLAVPAHSQTSVPKTAAPAASPAEVSLSALVQMQPTQIERLSRLADAFFARRAGQDANLGRLQTQLTQAQSPTSFDAKKTERLLREIDGEKQKMTREMVSTRGKALEILQPVQRAQLASIATDPRFQLRRDAFYALLLLPLEQFEGNRFSAVSNAPYSTRRTDNSGSGNYGVYGGYNRGGPQIGVYGGYGIGGLGVYGGLGRGGPSIGIGIGGLFGGRGRRW